MSHQPSLPNQPAVPVAASLSQDGALQPSYSDGYLDSSSASSDSVMSVISMPASSFEGSSRSGRRIAAMHTQARPPPPLCQVLPTEHGPVTHGAESAIPGEGLDRSRGSTTSAAVATGGARTVAVGGPSPPPPNPRSSTQFAAPQPSPPSAIALPVPRRKTREAEVSFPEFPAAAVVAASEVGTSTGVNNQAHPFSSHHLVKPPDAVGGAAGANRGTGVGPLSVSNSISTGSTYAHTHVLSAEKSSGSSVAAHGDPPHPANSVMSGNNARVGPQSDGHVSTTTNSGEAVLPLPQVLAMQSTGEMLPEAYSQGLFNHNHDSRERAVGTGGALNRRAAPGASAPENVFGATSTSGSAGFSAVNHTESSVTSFANTTKTDEMNYLFGSCHIPLNLAVMFNIFITVALVAILSIFPLNSVSIRSMDHVTSTLSASLANTLAESINANMYFLPLTVKNFASAWQLDRVTQAWNWSNEHMPLAMQEMCEMASFSRASSHLLYLTMSSPITGFGAYCSPQYSDDFLVGRHIVENTSDYRYIIDSNTFRYAQPEQVYQAVKAMNAWQTTVDFGGEKNPWHQVAVPWYVEYLESLKRGQTVGVANGATRFSAHDEALTALLPPTRKRARMPSGLPTVRSAVDVAAAAAAASSPQGAARTSLADSDTTNTDAGEKGWSVFTHDNVSIITYTIPFIDYAGNLAIISGALQPSGIVSVFPEGILSSDIGNAMVVEPSTGMVMINSWGEDTRVVFDNWNLRDPEGLKFSKREGLYVDSIDNPLMTLAVEQLGGRSGLANKPQEVRRWQVRFKDGNDDALALATRITDQAGKLNLIVIYVLKRSEYTANIDAVRIAVVISVVIILIIIALVDLVLVYLFLQPLRDVAAGLHDASQLKDGSSAVEGRISIIKEVADMQYHFKVMNGQLMRMKAFLPQGVLYPMSAWSGSDVQTESAFGHSFADHSLTETGGGDGGGGGGAGGDVPGSDEEGSFILPVSTTLGGGGGGEGGGGGRHGAMHLNERALHDEVNKFRRRYCTVVTFFMHIREADVAVSVVDGLVAAFMQGVIPSILRHGGVIEIHRPEAIVVSFGAHNRVSMHQSRAAKCALEVMDVLNEVTTIGPRVGCLLDVGEFYVGTCGAEQRYARVAFGSRAPVGSDLIKLSKSLDCQILVTQRFAAALDEHLIAMPVDSIMFPLSSKYTILYELRGSTKMLSSSAAESDVRAMVQQVKIAFHKMINGDYRSALQHLEPFETEDRQVARLAGACRTLVLKGIAKPFVRTIGRIKLSETDVEYDITDEADGQYPSHGHRGTENNWLPIRKGTFRKSPQSPGLDSTLLLINQGPSNTRIIEGLTLNEGAPVAAEFAATRGVEGKAGSSLVLGTAADGSTSSHLPKGSDTRSAETSQQPREDDCDDGALFEMFIEDDDDDIQTIGDGGYGTDTGTVVSASHHHNQNNFCEDASNGELPVQFVDFEGNRWTRSADRLGHGAFSIVYRGLSQSGNLVALKCFQLRARNVDVHTITEEVSVFANLHHENIVQYISIYVSEFYIIEIMEFVPGGSLDTLLTSFGSLSKNAVRRYLRDILRGLSYLHSMGIVHCDIKPHNVLLAMDGQCKLSDFGSALARATTSACKIDDVLEMRGTPGYMAPEVARGDVPTVKSDVFSLGVAVLELLMGKLPWQYVCQQQQQQQASGISDDSTHGARKPSSSSEDSSKTGGSGSTSTATDKESAAHVLVSDYAELQSPVNSKQRRHRERKAASQRPSTSGGTGDGGYFDHPTPSAASCGTTPAIPIENVLRNAVNLISSIGRGVVLPVIPDELDDDVRDFLQSCVHPDPAQRVTVDELLNHPWLM